MPVSPVARLLSTPTVDGVLTEVEPSPARTTPRLTDPLPTPPGGWPNPLSRLASADVVLFRYVHFSLVRVFLKWHRVHHEA